MSTPPAASPMGMPAAAQSLDRDLVRGLAWTGGMKWAVQGLTWAATLVVARILTPEDYGLVAMSAVYLGIVMLLSEFGIGASVIVLRSLSEEQTAQLNGLSVLTGLAGFLISCLAARPLGAFFDAPELPLVVIVMSTTFLITGFRTVPAALMSRGLRFRELAIIDGITGAVMALSMVLMAVAGLRYWTLVGGAVLSSAFYTGLTVLRAPHRFARPRPSAIGRAISFSSDVVVSRLCWYLYSSADFLVAGRFLGKAALGAYSMGWTLAAVPVEKVTSLVMQVTPAFFSAVQTDMPAMRRYLVILTEGISLLVFPAAIGLGLVADDFILAVLGEKWRAGILPLRLLALYAAVRAVTPLFPPVLTALGRTRTVLWANLAGLILLPTAFVIGSRWGTAGIAAGWMIAHPIIIVLMARPALRAIDLPPRRYLAALWPAASSSAIMAAAVLAVQTAIPADAAPFTLLSAQAATGALTFALVLAAFHRPRIAAFRSVIRHLRKDAQSS